MRKIIAIAGGKAGIGKTTISVNLSIALSLAGNSVCLFDADTAGGNVVDMIGATPEKGLSELIREEETTISDVMIGGPIGISVLPGGDAVSEMVRIDDDLYMAVVRKFNEIDDFDYLIIDTTADLSSDSLAIMKASDAVIVVISPEPEALNDGYAVIKLLAGAEYEGSVFILPNMFKTGHSADQAVGKIRTASHKSHGMDVEGLPTIMLDDNMPVVTTRKEPIMSSDLDCPAVQGFSSLSVVIEKWPNKDDGLGTSDFIMDFAQSATDEDFCEKINSFNQRRAGKAKKRAVTKEAHQQMSDTSLLIEPSGKQVGAPSPAPAGAPSVMAVPAEFLHGILDTQKEIVAALNKAPQTSGESAPVDNSRLVEELANTREALAQIAEKIDSNSDALARFTTAIIDAQNNFAETVAEAGSGSHSAFPDNVASSIISTQNSMNKTLEKNVLVLAKTLLAFNRAINNPQPTLAPPQQQYTPTPLQAPPEQPGAKATTHASSRKGDDLHDDDFEMPDEDEVRIVEINDDGEIIVQNTDH